MTAYLEDSGTMTATYFYPWPRDTPQAHQRFVEQHVRGPFYKVSYIKERRE